jgi:hypothetical protein
MSSAIALRLACAVLLGSQAGCATPPAPLKATGFATDVPQAAGFVQGTRGAATDFIPVGVTPPARTVQPRQAADVEALRQTLESTRQQHDALGGRSPAAAATLAQ